MSFHFSVITIVGKVEGVFATRIKWKLLEMNLIKRHTWYSAWKESIKNRRGVVFFQHKYSKKTFYFMAHSICLFVRTTLLLFFLLHLFEKINYCWSVLWQVIDAINERNRRWQSEKNQKENNRCWKGCWHTNDSNIRNWMNRT